MKRYLIIQEEDCPKCKGQKRNPNSDYQSLSPWCPECNGSGIIETKVDLKEALDDIEKHSNTVHVLGN